MFCHFLMIDEVVEWAKSSCHFSRNTLLFSHKGLEYVLRGCGGQNRLEKEHPLEHMSRDQIPVKALSIVTKWYFLLLFAIAIDVVLLVPIIFFIVVINNIIIHNMIMIISIWRQRFDKHVFVPKSRHQFWWYACSNEMFWTIY